MKKSLGLGISLLIGLLVIGCSSMPPMTSKEPTSFEGVWMREDGATWTFTGNYVEYFDMANGVAAHGLFRVIENHVIRIFLPENQIQLMYLKVSNWVPNINPKTSEFIRNAFYEYKNSYQTEVNVDDLKRTGIGQDEDDDYLVLFAKSLNELPVAREGDERIYRVNGAGWINSYYTLVGDTLTINIQISPNQYLKWHELINGQFVKQ